MTEHPLDTLNPRYLARERLRDHRAPSRLRRAGRGLRRVLLGVLGWVLNAVTCVLLAVLIPVLPWLPILVVWMIWVK